MFSKHMSTSYVVRINNITVQRGWTSRVASSFQYIETAYIYLLAHIFENTVNNWDSHNSFK